MRIHRRFRGFGADSEPEYQLEPEVQLDGFGFGIGCEEWRLAKSRLELLLAQAETTTGVRDTNAYLAAKKYYDDNSGFTGNPVILFGSACTAQVNEINGVISGLQAAISKAGSAPVVTAPPIDPSESPFDQIPSLVKWIAGGAIAVSAAYLIGPVVGAIFRKGKRR